MNGGKFDPIKPGTAIFFGPFIGEFGWELDYWQGWVTRVCRAFSENNRIIVSSRPGHAVFYPEADEFWPLPSWFTELGPAANQYVTAGWRHGLPGKIQWRQEIFKTLADGEISIEYVYEPHQVPISQPDIQPMAEAMLSEFKSRLPAETVYFIPWKSNICPLSGNPFGVQSVPDGEGTGRDFELIQIKPEMQEFLPLTPTSLGIERFDQIAGPGDGDNFISVHPRRRDFDTTRNWSEADYVRLIAKLRNRFPSHPIVIYGSPGGTHFDTGVLEGCLDLINIETSIRPDVQIAALNKSSFTVGSSSGGLSLARRAGCPVITSFAAYDEAQRRHLFEYLDVQYFTTSEIGCDVNEILNLASRLIPSCP